MKEVEKRISMSTWSTKGKSRAAQSVKHSGESHVNMGMLQTQDIEPMLD